MKTKQTKCEHCSTPEPTRADKRIKMKEELKQLKDAIKLAKQEIKEWVKFIKTAEKRLVKIKKPRIKRGKNAIFCGGMITSNRFNSIL